MTKRLTQRQRDVLDLLRPGPKSARQIASETDDTYDSVIARVRRLEDRELIRARPGPGVLKWELTHTGHQHAGRYADDEAPDHDSATHNGPRT